jgi:membrane protease YdiL (CAAX protease family)
MPETSVPNQKFSHRLILFALFIAGGWMIFLFGNNVNDLFPTNSSSLYKWGIALLFLVIAALLRRSERGHVYWEVAFALFIAAFANALNYGMGNWLGRLLPEPVSEMQDYAIDKVAQAVPIVLSIILLTLWIRNDLGSIFLKKGNLRWGIRFGLISFGAWAVIFTGIALLQAGAPSSAGLFASGVPLAVITSAIPWILVFCFTNSLMEELWFRGIFLGKLNPLLGTSVSVLATALVFGSVHLGATYVAPTQAVFFAAVTFVLGLVNGFVMQKTDSIWGSVFFHAGYDLLVILPLIVEA